MGKTQRQNLCNDTNMATQTTTCTQGRDGDDHGKAKPNTRNATAEKAMKRERAKMELRQGEATGQEAHWLYE